MLKVGVSLIPEHTSVRALRAAWRAADDLGVDSIWTWDHFFPVTGDPAGPSFECWSLVAAMAVDTRHATVGSLVSACGYRNPDLLADMARTVDHLSDGRAVLGLGAGWFERDYSAYGYRFGTAAERLAGLEAALIRVRARLAALRPPPLGPLPVLVGGSGERVTLRLVAQHADAWNFTGPIGEFPRRSAALDDWARRVGRDPGTIERTASVFAEDVLLPADAYTAAGVEHVVRSVRDPFDLSDVETLLAAARASGAGASRT
jgi:probable F420-dependent oxidoreductase